MFNVVNFHLKQEVVQQEKGGEVKDNLRFFFFFCCFHIQLLLVCCCGKFNKFQTFSIGKHIIAINFRPATSSMILFSNFLLPSQFFFIFISLKTLFVQQKNEKYFKSRGKLRMLLLLLFCVCTAIQKFLFMHMTFGWNEW